MNDELNTDIFSVTKGSGPADGFSYSFSESEENLFGNDANRFQVPTVSQNGTLSSFNFDNNLSNFTGTSDNFKQNVNGVGTVNYSAFTKPGQTYDFGLVGKNDPFQLGTDASVQGQLDKILSSDSLYLQRAMSKAQAQANQRGLLNSTMAAGAGQAAAIDAALPIAQQDAQFNFQGGQAQLDRNQQIDLTNAELQSRMTLADNERGSREYLTMVDMLNQNNRIEDDQNFRRETALFDFESQRALREIDFNNTTDLTSLQAAIQRDRDLLTADLETVRSFNDNTMARAREQQLAQLRLTESFMQQAAQIYASDIPADSKQTIIENLRSEVNASLDLASQISSTPLAQLISNDASTPSYLRDFTGSNSQQNIGSVRLSQGGGQLIDDGGGFDLGEGANENVGEFNFRSEGEAANALYDLAITGGNISILGQINEQFKDSPIEKSFVLGQVMAQVAGDFENGLSSRPSAGRPENWGNFVGRVSPTYDYVYAQYQRAQIEASAAIAQGLVSAGSNAFLGNFGSFLFSFL